MGFLDGLFKTKTATRQELIKEFAKGLVESQTKPPEFVGRVALAEGQTPDRALAEWYALENTMMTYALWASVGSRDKIFPILDMYQPLLLEALRPGCREIYLRIVSTREEQYMRKIAEVLESREAHRALAVRLATLMARRITGHYNEERQELEEGYFPFPDGPDIATAVGLWILVIGSLTGTKKVFDNLQRKFPRAFSGPMT